MKKFYECEVCGELFDSQEEAEKCEFKHAEEKKKREGAEKLRKEKLDAIKKATDDFNEAFPDERISYSVCNSRDGNHNPIAVTGSILDWFFGGFND